MDEKQFPTEEKPTVATDNSVSQQPAGAQERQQAPMTPNKGKKLLYGALAGVAVLLLILIVLLAMLLNKKDDDSSVVGSADTSSSTETETRSGDKKDILLIAPSTNSKLEYVIYKPKQNASNTTINFGVRSACEGCEDSINVFDATNQFDSKTNSYLLDDNLGKKYSPIKDEDDDVLATPNCFGSVKKGETFDCFVSFTKVPSGTTVSWVFGKNRIDGIKVE